LRLTETIPSGNSSEKALHLLINNKNIGLFPEGGLSQDGKLREFKRGAALLGFKTGRPIVPCAILGAYEALPRGARFPKFAPIKVRVGRPRYLLKEFEEVIDDVYLQEGIFKIRNTIQEMIHAG
jgi:1-acyl-sn-glycerol-3-phosphate acyltransferase